MQTSFVSTSILSCRTYRVHMRERTGWDASAPLEAFPIVSETLKVRRCVSICSVTTLQRRRLSLKIISKKRHRAKTCRKSHHTDLIRGPVGRDARRSSLRPPSSRYIHIYTSHAGRAAGTLTRMLQRPARRLQPVVFGEIREQCALQTSAIRHKSLSRGRGRTIMEREKYHPGFRHPSLNHPEVSQNRLSWGPSRDG